MWFELLLKDVFWLEVAARMKILKLSDIDIPTDDLVPQITSLATDDSASKYYAT